jgi:hypothetical protein
MGYKDASTFACLSLRVHLVSNNQEGLPRAYRLGDAPQARP